ncbi:nidogen [Thrips palmi]|uniref:Thrombomodulin n=1 Tax=Thrips palmi TaxID=161013 RepID=A0A6P8ZYD9_THRPL|nr:nidogen [Thrips palmi]
MAASTTPRRRPQGAAACAGVGVVALLLLQSAGAVQLSEFYPFGASVGPNVSQQALPTSYSRDSASVEARLRVPIHFYDVAYESVFVNTNGLLSFLTDIPQFLNLQFPLDYPVIAPFYANVDTSASGTVYFYESEEAADLQKAAVSVRRSFSSSTFQPTSVFVATWERVGYFSQGADKVNTFQVAVSSDGTQSYAEFLYADDGIQWVRGVSRQQGLPDARAQVGFVGGDGSFFEVRGSGTDHVINVNKWTNVNVPGHYAFRISPTEDHQIVQADLADAAPVDNATCVNDNTLCHSFGRCTETVSGESCCVCNDGYYGNGRQCLSQVVPLRVMGRLFGVLNEINITALDLQSYVLVQDGRSYTALSRVPADVGAELQLLTPVAMSIAWMFAKPAAVGAPNGFTLTGGTLTHSIEQFFPQSGERLTLTLRYLGLDVFDQLRLEVEVQGAAPSLPAGAKVNMVEHEEFFTRQAPGVLHASSRQAYTLDDAPLEHRFTVEQRIEYAECGMPAWLDDAVAAPADSQDEAQGLKLKASLSLISFEPSDNIVRFAPIAKITNKLNETDPCEEGRYRCGANSFCAPSGDSFECHCSAGYQKLVTEETVQNGVEECVDIDECLLGRLPCSPNARCINTPGGFSCECLPGFQGNGASCEPVVTQRSCAELGCDPVAGDCRDNRCFCVEGYEGDGYRCRPVRVDPREQDRRQPDPRYPDADPRYPDPRQPDPRYPDPDPRYPDPRYPDQRQPEPEPYPPRSNPNYQAPPPAPPCTVAEDCSPHGVCTLDERTGAKACVCLHGFDGDGITCQHVDLQPHCDPDGVSNCVCPEAYILDTNICLPAAEAAEESEISCDSANNCHPHASCVYVPALLQHKCVCNVGFSGDGFECSNNAGSCLDLQDCHPYAECKLLEHEDRYDCACRAGFKGDGRLQCVRDEPPGCEVTRDCHPEARCMPVGRKYQCVCGAGTQGDGKTCERTTPPGCEVLQDCGRFAECLRVRGEAGYRCQCLPGYLGDGYRCDVDSSRQREREREWERLSCGPAGSRRCTEKDSDYMVVAQGMALMKVPLLPPQTASQAGQPLQIHYFQEAIGVDVDCEEQRIYWSDVASKSIKSMFYNGTGINTFLDAEIVSPEGIAVDWVSRNIYWADSSKDTIEVASLDTKGRTTLVRDGLVNPRGIALHPQRGKLFWSDWDRAAPKLEWANLDGSQREVFLQGNAVKLPNSLAIDFDRDELCWADAGTKSIECIGISSAIRRTVVANVTYPFGLAMSEDNYFWTDWQSHKVESASRPEGAPRPAKDVPLGGSGKMYGLVVVPEACKRMQNPCGWQRGYCNPDQICLPDGHGNRRCVCPENQTCVEE